MIAELQGEHSGKISVSKLADYQAVNCRRGPTPSSPRVSIITVCLNAVGTLKRTIDSVQGQNFASLEHIVVDGDSQDGTKELLANTLRVQDFWISEADRGISDAFNKGVALARGSYLQFLNSDDWLSPGQVERSVEILERSDADFVFGDLMFHEAERPTFRYCGAADYARSLHRHLPPMNHPTVLARAQVFAELGLFDLRYRCAMDYDWLLRVHRAGKRGVYDPAILGNMTHDGVSNRQFRRTIEEVRQISIEHGRSSALATIEAGYRVAKSSIGSCVKSRARPLYSIIRRALNPSYRPDLLGMRAD
jgi:GT2 family glycosyltransferase